MNKSNHHKDDNCVDHRAMERMVDGELSLPEQHRVLRALEAEQDGWRRCALAFLEDQAIRKAFGRSLERTPERHNDPAGVVVRPPRRRIPDRSGVGSWTKLLSLAATILLAFSMGWWAESSRDRRSPAHRTFVESNNGANSGFPVAVMPGVNAPSDGNLAGRYYVNDSRVWEQESVIPADVRLSLQRVGADVQRQRGLIPMTLSNGRRISVPYEDVQLVPVSNRSY